MSGFLEIQFWPRRKHYELFRRYERPFFNICANVDVTLLKRKVDEAGLSFFLTSLYVSTLAANRIEAFRCRLRDEGVWVHDLVHAGSTILLPDETFGFAYFDFAPDLQAFHEDASKVVEAVRSGTVDAFDPRDDRDDLIHYSVIPWVSFTSFDHARRVLDTDSTPKIVFGKYFSDHDRLLMPVSVAVHHALVDGLHVGRYFDLFHDEVVSLADL